MRTTTKLITGGLTVLTMSTLLVGHAATATPNDAPIYHDAKVQQVSTTKSTPKVSNNTQVTDSETEPAPKIVANQSVGAPVTDTSHAAGAEVGTGQATPVADEQAVESEVPSQTAGDTDTSVTGETLVTAVDTATNSEAAAESEVTQPETNPVELGNAIFAARIRPVRYANEGGLYTIIDQKDADTIQIEVRQDNPDGTISNLRGMFYYHPSTDQIEETHIIDGTIHPFE
ncbi:MAG: hypothetical protein MR008_00530 [Aerococcus sp.]|nr:hypothetical protein [Aerococcus sp.]